MSDAYTTVYRPDENPAFPFQVLDADGEVMGPCCTKWQAEAMAWGLNHYQGEENGMTREEAEALAERFERAGCETQVKLLPLNYAVWVCNGVHEVVYDRAPR